MKSGCTAQQAGLPAGCTDTPGFKGSRGDRWTDSQSASISTSVQSDNDGHQFTDRGSGGNDRTENGASAPNTGRQRTVEVERPAGTAPAAKETLR